MKPIKCEFKTFVPVPVRYEFKPLHQPAADSTSRPDPLTDRIQQEIEKFNNSPIGREVKK